MTARPAERRPRRIASQLAAVAVATFLYVVIGLRVVTELMEGRGLGRSFTTAVEAYVADVRREPGAHLLVVLGVVAFAALAIWIASRTRRVAGLALLLAPALLFTWLVVAAELSQEEEPRACCARPPE